MSQKYVLYVGKDNHDPSIFCRGSKVLLDLVKPLKDDIVIQDVDVLIDKGVSLPEWLDGTPILVDMATKQALKGSEAARFVQELTSVNQQQIPQNQREEIPSMDQMTGMLASGERLLHEDANFDPAPQDAETMKIINRDDKITDAHLNII